MMSLQRYDSNVETVMHTLEAKGYGTSVTCLHKRCYKELRKWLEAEQRVYSPENVRLWQHSISDSRLRSSKGFATCIDQLLDVYEHGEILPLHFGFQTPNYELLIPELRSALDQYLSFRAAQGDQPSYINEIRCSCSRFLMCLQRQGVTGISSIRYDDLFQVFQSDQEKHRSRRIFNLTLAHSRNMLLFFAQSGVCSPGLSYILNPLLIGKVLRDSSFIPLNSQKQVSAPPWNEIPEFSGLLADAGYKKTALVTVRSTLILLFVFLDMHHLPLTDETAHLWFKREKPLLGTGWKGHRRALNQYLHFHKHDSLITSRTEPDTTALDRDDIPPWCKPVILKFLELLVREGRDSDTVSLYRSSICRFAAYLGRIHVTSFETISPETVIAFNSQDPHSTSEGKSACNSRIRNFLIYLEDSGLISNRYLHLSVPTVNAPKVRVVTTLDTHSVDAFWSLNQDNLSPVERRDYAITCIGLGMGVRGIDIVNLHFNDIDWTRSILSFTQHKTGVPVTLPIPVHVANAIFRYYTVRPKSSCDFIFVNSRAPYMALNRAACCKAVKRFFPESGGFHDTRRTFATNLLRNSTQMNVITDSLGHTTDDTISRYLSLDEERIRRCSIPMAEISITMKGGFHEERV